MIIQWMKDQQFRLIGYILLIIGVLVVVQSIVFVFGIGSNLSVPINLFSDASGLYSSSLFRLFNFMSWLAIIFFVLITGLLIITKAIALLTLQVDYILFKKLDYEEIKTYSKEGERFYR